MQQAFDGYPRILELAGAMTLIRIAKLAAIVVGHPETKRWS